MKLLATLAACSIAALGASRPSAAMADQAYKLDIPAQDLGTALKAFGVAVNEQVLYSRDVVAGLRSTAVKGEFTSNAAIAILLEGSGLQADRTSSGVLLIRRPPTAHTLTSNQAADPGSPDANSADKEGKNSSSDGFRVAQMGQGQTAETTSVETEKKTEEKRPAQLETILVTGTHIQGSTNPTAPMLVIDRADIEASGYTNVQELVASIPQNFGGGSAGATEDGAFGTGNLRNNNDVFGTGINLRGLGNSSTLVLVDGHRLAPSSFGLFADASTIPLTAIDRVEIMADGASAIYGTDAVAGVVNFVLRKDYDGQETWASYAPVIDASRQQGTVGQSVGRDWSGGNALALVQYQSLGAIGAADRSYTSSSLEPTQLLPKANQFSATLNARQDVGPGLDVSSDILYSRENRSAISTQPGVTTSNSSHTDAGVATVDLGYQPSQRWHIDASGSYSREDTVLGVLYVPQQVPSCGTEACVLVDNFSMWTGDLVASGTLFSTPGGETRVALGGSYRSEALTYDPENYASGYTINGGRPKFDRHVSAGFAELELPIFGTANAQPLLRKLDVSLAVRRDDYSDFGGTTNPRYGVAWEPVEHLRVRAAYSTSFRAPTANEEVTAVGTPTGLYQVAFPSASGSLVPVFFQAGGGPPLQPEKSRNITAGFDLKLQDLDFSANYFNIRYRDRLLVPTFDAAALSQLDVYGSLITPISSDAAAQAYINKTTSEGLAFQNFSGFPDGAGVRYLFNDYELNAALATLNGLDLIADYRVSAGQNQFHMGVNVTYVAHLDTSYTAASSATDLINTYANPLHWRGRGVFGWSRGAWSANAALNVSGSYVDTTTVPFSSVASWTTVDAQLAYTARTLKGLTLSLSGTNLFNRDPPYVVGTNQFDNAIHYDVGNGSPLGRLIVLAARLAW